VRTGTAELDGHPVWLAVFDFRFVGGTLSIVAGERLARGLEAAAASGVPYVLVTASGGARMQEGVLALMQLAKVNGAVGRLHASRTPYFSVLTDPTFGGVSASLALMADVNLAEPGAAIGFTGARVIKQATYADLPKGFQSAEFQLAHGQVDMVVPRTEIRRRLSHLLELYR
jgi:acetyl-CoA carboxylase carboxyl transferase beta subunit